MMLKIINNDFNNDIKIKFFVPIEYYCGDSDETSYRPIGTRLTGERAKPNGGERTHSVCVCRYRACVCACVDWNGTRDGEAEDARAYVLVRASGKENGNGDGRRRRRVTMPPARW